MSNINQVTVSGNLTRDAELRELKNDNYALNFSIACNDVFYDREAEDYAEYANFIDCVMFGKRAAAIADYLKKGAKVCVAGKLHYSSWETDEGKRSKLEVQANEIEFMSRAEEKPVDKKRGGRYSR